MFRRTIDCILPIVATLATLHLAARTACAQSSYPMVMNLKPTAAQVGTTSEHALAARYDLSGAYKVIVGGTGVTGVPILPDVKPGEKPAPLNEIKLKFTVSADALPGVRDIRVATPLGVSTLGQLVIVTDPVVSEQADNDTAAKAQPIPIPATACGTFEKGEDIDFYKFRTEAGQTLNFHVRCNRLQNRIHDLQQHADPILVLRTVAGMTLAQSDNYFAADPFLSYKFESAGEYLLEIRDLRYQGNSAWEYCIEISDKPYVTQVHPLGVNAGKQTTLNVVGTGLAGGTTAPLAIAGDAARGVTFTQLPLPGGLSNPVGFVVHDLPEAIEAESLNNSIDRAQPIAVPCGISGRIESPADIDCYVFDAKQGDRISFDVVSQRCLSLLDSAIRILDAGGNTLVEQDDMSLGSKNLTDSALDNWTAPADGKFIVEIRDVLSRGGAEFVYLLRVNRSVPAFDLYIDTDKTLLTPGNRAVMFVRSVRKNGFQGPIELRIDGLPRGVTASSETIPPDATDGSIILAAAGDAGLDAANVTVTGTAKATLDDKSTIDLAATAVPQQETYLPGGGRGLWQVDMHTVSVGMPGDIRRVELNATEVALNPGESKRVEFTIERAPGFDKNILVELQFQHLGTIYGNTLPAGVSVDAASSKTLLTGSDSTGYVTLVADAAAKPSQRRQVSVMANISLNFVMKSTYSSAPLWVTIADPAAKK